jgi:hypothetical protein
MGKQSDIMIKYKCAFLKKHEQNGKGRKNKVTVQVLV